MSKFLKHAPKLLAAAAALTVAGMAQAEVSVYGVVDVSYGKNEYIGDAKADIHSGGDNGSSEGNSVTRFGILVSNQVAPGVKANVKLESAGIKNDGALNSNALFDRQAWAGLSGALGEVRVGRQDNVAFQTQISYDPNGFSNGVSALAYTGVGAYLTVGRQNRSVQYISPDLSGVKVQVGFQPQDSQNQATTKSNYGLGATYAAGPLSASVSYQSKVSETGDDYTGLSASYDFGVAKTFASYADNGEIAKGGSGKGFGLGVAAPVAGYTVGAIYAANSKGTKDKAVELFVNREVFKNLTAYVEFGKLKSDSLVKDGSKSYATGVIYAF